MLERLIAGLLLVVGIALIFESFLPKATGRLLPNGTATDIIAGILFGLGIGLVSSLLGVAGGEVIIPTLIFAYGADIKVAGTASLRISLPTVFVGIVRYARGVPTIACHRGIRWHLKHRCALRDGNGTGAAARPAVRPAARPAGHR